jgi:hypothetical protein
MDFYPIEKGVPIPDEDYGVTGTLRESFPTAVRAVGERIRRGGAEYVITKAKVKKDHVRYRVRSV